MKTGLLGRKLGHSYSPQIHAYLGDYSYELFEREPEDVESFLKNGDFTAINVTIPYKTAIIPVCDYYGYDDFGHANGVVFLAIIHHLSELPVSEMKEVRLFEQLPEEMTYPNVSPVLYAEAEKVLRGVRSRDGF